MTHRQLNLNAFIYPTGHHEASWRHRDSTPERIYDVRYFQELARAAEAAKLDAVFFADGPALRTEVRYRPDYGLEPITTLVAMATVTTHLGLIATASTTYYEPYNLARLFSSLDHISTGRAGWNIVTTASDAAAANFGLTDHPDVQQRYARAREFVDATVKLWDSWEDDAVVADKAAGVYADPDKIHRVDVEGEYVSVRGPFNSARSPQGRPVLVQAGSSNDGRDFAAHYAEAIFTAHQRISDAQTFYTDIKSRAADAGRNPGHVKILPGLSPFLGATEAEARELQQEFNELTIVEYGLGQLQKMGRIDVSGLDLDTRVPPELFAGAGDITDNDNSRRLVFAKIVEREQPTLRRLLHKLAGARGHNVVAGTPVQVADIIEEWFTRGAADGFNIMPPQYPQGLEAFTTTVVPILQERGLFRTEYTGTTLRDHYGLPRPESQYARTLATAGTA
ncbi:LLM class flavin-dependent oxidoreductase [Rhodococcus coprophilus]|uniref:Nitrilotriacetate monooxygenase n=1 Tax=Rhodococcus coprophilus TaxID=38310 RepID=A0A2X4X9L1_9NOCA|nr:LLM class flavin-dependent oxidoreductase [Rhodococcus coprophilus]MBM7458711.1 FMN-dependent oxidoreductase (nitrilotriacetate monooxygenase family) [Rhodococcus coprophilus]SQI33264.1 nitrilotriacetate monooxygenase [Rhodococcus coprophilus]